MIEIVYYSAGEIKYFTIDSGIIKERGKNENHLYGRIFSFCPIKDISTIIINMEKPILIKDSCDYNVYIQRVFREIYFKMNLENVYEEDNH